MMQQINLFPQSMVEKKEPFSFKGSLVLLGLTLFAALLLSIFFNWRLGRMEQEVNGLQAAQAKVLQEMEEVRKKFPPRRKSRLLEEKLVSLHAELKERKALLQLFGLEGLTNKEGFSQALEGLARQGGSNLWLNRIEFSNGGQRLLLEGGALAPERVPRHLQALAREDALKGFDFSSFELFRDESGTFRFLMKTSEEAEE